MLGGRIIALGATWAAWLCFSLPLACGAEVPRRAQMAAPAAAASAQVASAAAVPPMQPAGLALSGQGACDFSFSTAEFAISGQLGIELVAEDPLRARLWLSAPQTTLPGLVLQNLRVEAEADLAQRVLKVTVAEFAALGGHVALQPFSLEWGGEEEPLALAVKAQLQGLSLAQLAAFVPETLRAASGSVSGQVALRWSAATGLQLGTGALAVEADELETPQLTLSAMPGFLTQHTTRRIQILPTRLGRLARWLSLENPAYETLEAVELGAQPLAVESLRVALYPDGTGGARSAAVSLVARPISGVVVEQLRFDINVSGPLDEVLSLGASESMRFSFGKN